MAALSVENRDKRISWSLMFYFVATAINYTIKSVFPISESLWSLLSIVTGASIVLMLLRCVTDVYRRVSRYIFMSYALFLMLYLVSAIMCISRGEPLNLMGTAARTTLAFYIPIGVYTVAVVDKKVLYDVMLKASNILFAIMAFRIMANYNLVQTDTEELSYSMSFGYFLIVPALFHFNEFFHNKKKVVYLLLFVLEVIGIILFASRGVLLSIIAFVLYCFFIGSENIVSKIVSVFLFLFLFLFLQNYWDSLLSNTLRSLNSMGVQSRTLDMLEANALNSDSGRAHLFDISYQMIEEKPLLGWGLGGEYYHFASELNDPEPNTACTSHNGILQAMVQFGVIGGLLATLLVIAPIFGLKKYKNPYLRQIIAVYFCAYTVPALTISSGFFTQPQIAISLFLFYFSGKTFS